ncbi:cell division protein ZapA [Acanthopleuribacter pedis]|uniref:Cell division protein ZapA n=1 Tax=Acanthopleuribacter pedis TaxID=442870 RepID=A0A8J7QD01_9BACT|nr:cell division protein ZapA [Acanthopleuribacter pedis]
MNTGHSESIPVEIFGRTYLIRAKDNKQYIENLAKMVDEKMEEVGAATKTVDSVRVAVLTALNLADEYTRAREHYEQQIRRLSAERETLLEMIDSALDEEPPITPA